MLIIVLVIGISRSIPAPLFHGCFLVTHSGAQTPSTRVRVRTSALTECPVSPGDSENGSGGEQQWRSLSVAGEKSVDRAQIVRLLLMQGFNWPVSIQYHVRNTVAVVNTHTCTPAHVFQHMVYILVLTCSDCLALALTDTSCLRSDVFGDLWEQCVKALTCAVLASTDHIPYTPCMEYIPTLTPLAPPQLIGIYGSPMERLGMAVGQNLELRPPW